MNKKLAFDDNNSDNEYFKIKRYSKNSVSKRTVLEIATERSVCSDSEFEINQQKNTNFSNNNNYNDEINNSDIEKKDEAEDFTQNGFFVDDTQFIESESEFDAENEIEKLYESACLTVKEACLLICGFSKRHKLSQIAKDDLVNLVKTFLPIKNKLPKTMNSIEDIACNNDEEILTKYYCNNCLSPLNTNSVKEKRNEHKCENEGCKTVNKSPEVFVYTKIENQLRNLIEIYHETILNFMNESRNYIDLIDSPHYKNKKHSNTLKLMVYTDGMQFSKKPSKSVWPVICSLCELPPRLRDSYKNRLIAGVWYGANKPTSEILFTSLVNEIKHFSTNGLELLLNEEKVHVFIEIYGVITDTPAKCMVMNMKQFNGYYSCPQCLQKGTWRAHRMLFTNTTKKIALRSNKHFVENAQAANLINRPCFGILGYSVLNEVIELPHAIPYDYMHLVFEGLFDDLLRYWFCKKSTLLTAENMKEIQQIISNIKFPHDLNRKNLIIENYSSWKSSEIRTFFLFLGIPILSHFLPQRNLWNLSCIVHAIRLLHTIKDNQSIETAAELIESFKNTYPLLYGINSQTFTYHAISNHLINDARLHGSLSNHSMFALEGSLGLLRKEIHGNRGVAQQACKALKRSTNLNLNVGRYCESKFGNDDVKEHLKNWFSNVISINKEINLLKPYEKISAQFLKNYNVNYNLNVQELLTSERIQHGLSVFHTVGYDSDSSSCSHRVKYKKDDSEFYGEIQKFFIYKSSCFAIIEQFFIDNETSLHDNLTKKTSKANRRMENLKYFNNDYVIVKKTNLYDVIRCKEIIEKSIFFNCKGKQYATTFISENEHD